MRELDRALDVRRQGRPASLTRDAIATASLAQIERLSIGRVATALGVGASSLYHHVSGRAELILLAADQAAGDIAWPADFGDWRPYLHDAADSVLDVLHAHTGLALALQELGVPPPRLLERMRTGIRDLERSGFANADAALTISLVGRLAVDAALLADAYAPEGAEGLADDAGPPDFRVNMHDKLSLVIDGLSLRQKRD